MSKKPRPYRTPRHKRNPPSQTTAQYTMAEQIAMAQADTLCARVMKRIGVTDRNQLDCPRAKSSMTPCVARDGGLAVAFKHSKPVCVGCEFGIDWMIAREDEREVKT